MCWFCDCLQKYHLDAIVFVTVFDFLLQYQSYYYDLALRYATVCISLRRGMLSVVLCLLCYWKFVGLFGVLYVALYIFMINSVMLTLCVHSTHCLPTTTYCVDGNLYHFAIHENTCKSHYCHDTYTILASCTGSF